MTAVEEYSEAYKTNHIMWLFGTGWSPLRSFLLRNSQ